MVILLADAWGSAFGFILIFAAFLICMLDTK